MRAVLQRVRAARVSVDGETVGAVERGLLVYVGVADGDHAADAEWLARRIAELRLFPAAAAGGKPLDRSVAEVGGGVLVVSQFTLLADTHKGRRPSFFAAADPATAEARIGEVMAALRARGLVVAGGRFGAHMQVESVNDGPVTILLDSAAPAAPGGVRDASAG